MVDDIKLVELEGSVAEWQYVLDVQDEEERQIAILEKIAEGKDAIIAHLQAKLKGLTAA